jgi:hypothetical protein
LIAEEDGEVFFSRKEAQEDRKKEEGNVGLKANKRRIV